ncbi:MAG TPA: ZIP family metal transporter [Candidatus Nanoarchaeia archaeon]|nr:ZIP family metal transporter [Candidatus Nanoarchaeia archaeon]
MISIVFYTFLSVIIVSLISFIGAITLSFKFHKIQNYLLILVSLSAGSLFGDAFIHLLPEAVEQAGFTLSVSLSVLAGMLLFFILEKFIHLHHQDISDSKKISSVQKSTHHHGYHLGVMNVLGDGIHNFIDGLIIAGSFMVGVPIGIATTIAVIFHEIPQEIGDFGVLLYSGMPVRKALFFNFLSAITAIAGGAVGLILGSSSEAFTTMVIPFAAGGFLYIAGTNLIPELHKECSWKESVLHVAALVLGIGIMAALLFLE